MMQVRSPLQSFMVVLCAVFTVLFWNPSVQADDAHKSCSTILGGLTSENLQKHVNEMINAKEPNEVQYFSNPQSDLDHEKLGPIAQEVFSNMQLYLVGHDDVKAAIARAVQKTTMETKTPGRPAGVFLLAGITGTGKSETILALAKALGLPEDAVTTIDCGEMQQEHQIARFTGAPLGYRDHDEEPLITQKLLDERTSPKYKVNLLLIDEIEKAHGDFKRLLLGVLEKAKLTLSSKSSPTIDFSHTIIVITTNLGQDEMQDILHGNKNSIGFVQTTTAEKTDLSIKSAAIKAITRGLAPEFRNRIDDTFVFLEPTKEEADQILNMNLATAQRKSFFDNENAQILFNVNPAARAFLIQNGFEPEMGGRSLRRTVNKLIVDPLTNLIGSGELKSGDLVDVGVSSNGDKLTFRRVAHGLSLKKQIQIYRKIYGDSVPVPKEPEVTAMNLVTTATTMPAMNSPIAVSSKAPQTTTTKDNLHFNFSQVKDEADYMKFVINLHTVTDQCEKLAMMASYIQTSPYFFDRIYGEFLRQTPKEVLNCGQQYSGNVLHMMQTDSYHPEHLLQSALLTLEPYQLAIVVAGARRLISISDAYNRRSSIVTNMYAQIAQLNSWYANQINSTTNEKDSVFDTYLNGLIARVEQLPPPQS